MLSQEYLICNAVPEDVTSWITLVDLVKESFPGLENISVMENYKQTLIKNIERKTALCVKYKAEIAGVLLFSFNSNCLSFMAVHPHHRQKGIATALINQMLSQFPDHVNISVTTFREGDEKGITPRKIYKKFGFEEDELVTEFDYPLQKFILHRR